MLTDGLPLPHGCVCYIQDWVISFKSSRGFKPFRPSSQSLPFGIPQPQYLGHVQCLSWDMAFLTAGWSPSFFVSVGCQLLKQVSYVYYLSLTTKGSCSLTPLQSSLHKHFLPEFMIPSSCQTVGSRSFRTRRHPIPLPLPFMREEEYASRFRNQQWWRWFALVSPKVFKLSIWLYDRHVFDRSLYGSSRHVSHEPVCVAQKRNDRSLYFNSLWGFE